MKFTNGPWRQNKRGHLNIESETGRMIASCAVYNSNIDGEKVDAENADNAKLIAAAPEMFELLLYVSENSIDSWHQYGNDFRGALIEPELQEKIKQLIDRLTLERTS